MKLPRRNLVLWLLVAPFIGALITGALFYIIVQNYDYLIEKVPNSLNVIAGFIIIVVIGVGGSSWSYIAVKIYDEPESWDKKTDAEIETAVDDLQYATKFFYILIFVILAITAFFFFNAINEVIVLFPRLLYISTPALVSLSAAVITLVIAVIGMGAKLVRKDFQFYKAKMSVHVLGNTQNNEDKRMRFLGILLNSYNEFLEKNLRVEFDTAKVFSMILTATDKDAKIKEIVKSFEENDKYKPVISLSEVKNSEEFLVKKRFWTNVNEVGTFLAVVIPALIAVVQLIQSIF